MKQEEVWEMSDEELIDELGAINGTDREQRMIEREALRRILKRLSEFPTE